MTASPSAPGAPEAITATTIAAELIDQALGKLHGLGESTRVNQIVNELERALVLLHGHEHYPVDMTAAPSATLQALAEGTSARDWREHDGEVHQEMLSGHLEGALLRLLVRATGAQRVLEVGTFTGYSALAMAEAMSADDSVSPTVVTCEVDNEVAALAREAIDGSPVSNRVQIEVGPASQSIKTLAAAGEVFDLVFIDADKTGYSGYVDQVLDEGLLRPGGLLCLDNTLLRGEVWAVDPSANAAAIHAVNKKIAADERLEQVLVPIRDGLTLAWRIPS